MGPSLKLLLLLTFATIAAGCSTARGTTKPTGPAPDIVQVPVLVYVPVNSALTDLLPIAKGGLAECPAVARKRKEQLETCNADRAAVAKLQGKPVPESKP